MKTENGERRFFTRRKITAIVVGVILAIVVPIIIDVLYRGKPKIETWWGPTDLLQFYGCVLSSVALIWAVYLLITYHMFQQKEMERIKMKPFFRSEIKAVPLAYFNHMDTDLNYISKHDTYTTTKAMPFLLRKALESNKYIDSVDASTCSKEVMEIYTMHVKNVTEFMHNYFLMSYQLTNVGLGNAIKIDMKINDNLIVSDWNLCMQKTVPFMFYLDMSEAANGDDRDLTIEYSYQDLFSDIIYKQQEKIHIYRDSEGVLSMSQKLEHMMSYPVVENKDKSVKKAE